MKMLILTEGGNKTGFGHITRCSALCQALQKAVPSAKINFVVYGDKYARRLLRASNVKASFYNWIENEDKTYKLVRQNDITVIDSYIARKSIYEVISNMTSGNMLMVDDYNRIDYPKGVVVNPSIYESKSDYRKSKRNFRLSGQDYIILRREFWKVPGKKIRMKIKDVLVTLGGMDNAEFLAEVIESVLFKYDFNFHIVIAEKRLRPSSLKTGHIKMNFYSDISVKDMRSLMLKCDFCISGGGQTLFELARCGTPTIGICLAKNQIRNLKALEKLGFLAYAGWYNSKEIFDRLNRAVKNLIACEIRQQKSRKAKDLIDGKGAERIIDYFINGRNKNRIFEKVFFRPASEEDCRDLWLWRNNSEVRKWSLSRERISYDKHREWFQSKLRDKRVNIYVFENKNGNKIGQVRFEITKNLAHININLNPKYIGQGFGKRIIRQATGLFFRKKHGIVEVIAEVLKENVASRRAFERAGYVFSRNVIKGKRILSVFKKTRE